MFAIEKAPQPFKKDNLFYKGKEEKKFNYFISIRLASAFWSKTEIFFFEFGHPFKYCTENRVNPRVFQAFLPPTAAFFSLINIPKSCQ